MSAEYYNWKEDTAFLADMIASERRQVGKICEEPLDIDIYDEGVWRAYERALAMWGEGLADVDCDLDELEDKVVATLITSYVDEIVAMHISDCALRDWEDIEKLPGRTG